MIRLPWKLLFGPACSLALILLLALHGKDAVAQGPQTRQQALQALSHADPAQRLAAMLRLADIGTAEDAQALLPRLADRDTTVRRVALPAIWRLWGRSGDAVIDALYEQGLNLMQARELPKAVLLFSEIIARRPAFAEAWNKRATIYFLLDQYELSMKDCEEVLQRIPQHFGALSGYAQMLTERGELERALELLERAYQVNPSMGNAELMIQDLKRQIEQKRKKST